MPSPADIPDHLVSPDKKAQFILWVRSSPTTIATRRSLLFFWRKRTDATLDAIDYQTAMLNALPEKPHPK